jgi:hypothetical protein
MKVYVLTALSESGDYYGPFVFDKEPTEAIQRKIIEEEIGEELDVDGPGDFDSYVYLEIHQREVQVVS